MSATPDESREDIVGLYHRAWAHSDATIDALGLDAAGRVPWWPEDVRDVTLHRILVHMTTETARHAGQADIVRELIDGTVGLARRQRQHGAARRRPMAPVPRPGRAGRPCGRRGYPRVASTRCRRLPPTSPPSPPSSTPATRRSVAPRRDSPSSAAPTPVSPWPTTSPTPRRPPRWPGCCCAYGARWRDRGRDRRGVRRRLRPRPDRPPHRARAPAGVTTPSPRPIARPWPATVTRPDSPRSPSRPEPAISTTTWRWCRTPSVPSPPTSCDRTPSTCTARTATCPRRSSAASPISAPSACRCPRPTAGSPRAATTSTWRWSSPPKSSAAPVSASAAR